MLRKLCSGCLEHHTAFSIYMLFLVLDLYVPVAIKINDYDEVASLLFIVGIVLLFDALCNIIVCGKAYAPYLVVPVLYMLQAVDIHYVYGRHVDNYALEHFTSFEIHVVIPLIIMLAAWHALVLVKDGVYGDA